MAKLERQLQGDFKELLGKIEQGIMKGSVSASLEDGSDFVTGDVQAAVRVFERYSWIEKNRVSLSVTLLAKGRQIFVSAISSGGSQAVFMKLNTFGESAFLSRLSEILDQYRG